MKYDLIVIGSGPGGYVAAIRASQLGMKTAVVERESLGGICLNWGCIPTKALLKSAQVFEYIKHASDYGIKINDASADFPAMVKRSRNTADGMSKGIQFLFKKNKIDTIMGHGKVKGENKVSVSDEKGKETTYEAGHIILAPGARARELPDVPVDDKKVIEYRRAMNMDKQPESMLVMGSGAIGSEFAYFYQALGTKVTLVEYMDRVVPNEDEEISKQLERSFKKQGMKIHTGSKVEKVDTSGKKCKVTVATEKGKKEVECDVVLSAVGVQPNTEKLGLEEAGIKKDGDHIAVDEFFRTNLKSVYAIGDAIKGPALAHLASAEGICCVEKIAGKEPEALDYNNVPACTYCQPEIASVGYTEKEAKDAGYDIKVGNFPFSASGKANAAGKKEGMVKVIFDAKYGEWLGAHMMGDGVTEMIAEAVAARKLETTGHEIIKSIHPHPTMSEAVMEAVAAAYDEVIHI